MGEILNRKFYTDDTIRVAKKLLGCVLVRKIGKNELRAIITETEAYIGEDDLASHASKGRTPRTELMFGQAGHAYIYLIYGMYHCMNVVTEKKGFPAAVLIRSVIIDGVDKKKTNGPGKVCRQLQIDRKLSGNDVTNSQDFWIEKGIEIASEDILIGKRIGVAYAKHSAELPWRFWIDENKISRLMYETIDDFNWLDKNNF